jgi:hypothetical protein
LDLANGAEVKPTIFVVLGTHRCGTSLLANMLRVLGVPLGGPLLGSRPGNLAGLWEHEEIVHVQEELLRSLGRQWFWQGGGAPMPAGWLQKRSTISARKKLQKITSREIQANGGRWGFKDPRTSRLLPLWMQIIEELGLKPKFVISLRDPQGMADSLYRRDRMPADAAGILWLVSYLEIWRTVPDAIQIRFEDWFSDAAMSQAKALAKYVGCRSPSVAASGVIGIVDRTFSSGPVSGKATPDCLRFAHQVYEEMKPINILSVQSNAPYRDFLTEREAVVSLFAAWPRRYEAAMAKLQRELKTKGQHASHTRRSAAS